MTPSTGVAKSQGGGGHSTCRPCSSGRGAAEGQGAGRCEPPGRRCIVVVGDFFRFRCSHLVACRPCVYFKRSLTRQVYLHMELEYRIPGPEYRSHQLVKAALGVRCRLPWRLGYSPTLSCSVLFRARRTFGGGSTTTSGRKNPTPLRAEAGLARASALSTLSTPHQRGQENKPRLARRVVRWHRCQPPEVATTPLLLAESLPSSRARTRRAKTTHGRQALTAVRPC